MAEVTYLVVELGLTHYQVAERLQRDSGLENPRGLSERTVRRFCQENGISRRTPISDCLLTATVRHAVSQVGPYYGRRTIQGLLSARYGIRVNQTRIGQTLRSVDPEAHRRRTHTARRQFNPVRYTASYFGEKLHFDQNEKLVMYGVTHVLAIDGYSRKIVGFLTIPVKNAVAIYAHLFRPILLSDGIFDQVRTDHGREFDLVVAVQEALSTLRSNQERRPFARTRSRENLRAERFWVEVNQRVNYPLKACLRSLEHDEVFDLDDDHQRFSVSWVATQIAYSACELFIDSWNAHRLPGSSGGIPNVLAQRVRSAQTGDVGDASAPTLQEAVDGFTDAGGTLTLQSAFGVDPLLDRADLIDLRQRLFNATFPDLLELFGEVTRGEYGRMRGALEQVMQFHHDHLL